jgi:hypothetical protein
MARMESRGKRDQGSFHLESDIGFIIGATIVAIGAVLLVLALGVGVSPDADMLVPPNP